MFEFTEGAYMMHSHVVNCNVLANMFVNKVGSLCIHACVYMHVYTQVRICCVYYETT